MFNIRLYHVIIVSRCTNYQSLREFKATVTFKKNMFYFSRLVLSSCIWYLMTLKHLQCVGLAAANTHCNATVSLSPAEQVVTQPPSASSISWKRDDFVNTQPMQQVRSRSLTNFRIHSEYSQTLGLYKLLWFQFFEGIPCSKLGINLVWRVALLLKNVFLCSAKELLIDRLKIFGISQ